jgi:hypothetical protein
LVGHFRLDDRILTCDVADRQFERTQRFEHAEL